MTNRLDDAIVAVLRDQGPLDDDRLGTEIGTTRQSARYAAIRLSRAGVVVRRKGAGVKWTTELLSAERLPTANQTSQRPAVLVPPIDLGAVSTAIDGLRLFLGGQAPRVRVKHLEGVIVGAGPGEATAALRREHIDDDVLRSALLVKRVAGEVNVLIHALGILLALPHILEDGEKVIATSLGAGTGGKRYDLETSHRIAEFKFTQWRGHDAVRQREVFADFVNLAEGEETRKRQLFVTGAALPQRFLWSSKRSLASVCERRPEVLTRIRAAHGEALRTVADYTAVYRGRVELIDLERVLPAYVVSAIQVADAGELDLP